MLVTLLVKSLSVFKHIMARFTLPTHLEKIQCCWKNNLIQPLSHIRSQVTCESC